MTPIQRANTCQVSGWQHVELTRRGAQIICHAGRVACLEPSGAMPIFSLASQEAQSLVDVRTSDMMYPAANVDVPTAREPAQC